MTIVTSYADYVPSEHEKKVYEVASLLEKAIASYHEIDTTELAEEILEALGIREEPAPSKV